MGFCFLILCLYPFYYQFFVNRPCAFLPFPVNEYGTDFDTHSAHNSSRR